MWESNCAISHLSFQIIKQVTHLYLISLYILPLLCLLFYFPPSTPIQSSRATETSQCIWRHCALQPLRPWWGRGLLQETAVLLRPAPSWPQQTPATSTNTPQQLQVLLRPIHIPKALLMFQWNVSVLLMTKGRFLKFCVHNVHLDQMIWT